MDTHTNNYTDGHSGTFLHTDSHAQGNTHRYSTPTHAQSHAGKHAHKLTPSDSHARAVTSGTHAHPQDVLHPLLAHTHPRGLHTHIQWHTLTQAVSHFLKCTHVTPYKEKQPHVCFGAWPAVEAGGSGYLTRRARSPCNSLWGSFRFLLTFRCEVS